MKIAIIYYSRTGNTRFVVDLLRDRLVSMGLNVDVFLVKPTREYGKPLHFNLRVFYDTVVKRGTSIKIEPKEFNYEEYDVVIMASPIWIMNLTPPIQELLKKRVVSEKPIIFITTSGLKIDCSKITRSLENRYGIRPVSCINLDIETIRARTRLVEKINDIAEKLTNIHLKPKAREQPARADHVNE